MAAVWSAQLAQGQTTYTYNSSATATVDWHVSANWTPSGIPDAPGDAVIFNRPLVTPSGAFTINLPAEQDTTVGSITVDNSAYNNGNISRINSNGGQLIFQTTSGPATYNENAGTVANSPGRIEINAPITLLSDLVVTQDNIPDLNTGTIFSSLINGASNLTITKEGVGGLQLNYGFALGAGEGFEGQFVINEGSLRVINPPTIAKSTGITVNSGGQFQLGQNNANPVPDWSLASGAVLNLNGNGKASGNSPEGALRFQLAPLNQSGVTSTFHNPVNLQSDSRIVVNPADIDTINTGVLDNVVSGSGHLSKGGNGVLILSNSGNSYTGDTEVLAGTLSITNPYLANAADVYLTTGSFFNLNFSGTDEIDSLFIDGVSQAVGTWGATGTLGVDFTTDLITGTGILDVTTFVSPGLDGDYNDDGVVDAADYVAWRRNPDDFGGDPDGFNTWRANFGATSSGAGGAESVPEPNAALLSAFALFALFSAKVVRTNLTVN